VLLLVPCNLAATAVGYLLKMADSDDNSHEHPQGTWLPTVTEAVAASGGYNPYLFL